tara:strand:- start:622 stop:876 length:255 start_codon:yes stop_codon:yes gene_type:complete
MKADRKEIAALAAGMGEDEAKAHCDAENLALVNEALKRAREHGLEAEVVWSALLVYKNEHNLGISSGLPSMEEALETALGEWDI